MKILIAVLSLVAALSMAAPQPPPSIGGGSVAKRLSAELADTVQKVMPSVVVVRTEATRYYRAYDMFFGRRLTIPETQAGQGSGMIMDAEGHILTSRHVVSGAQEIEVVLTDETSYSAKVVGMDANTDLAVLKIQKAGDRKFPALEFGNSDAVRIGEIVIAIGSPFSLSSSVTMGIVSQKGRSIGALPFEDFIQTDAPINPGNSGGPLIDLDGRLIGVNAVIQTSGGSQGNLGIGFAVPVNIVRRVAEALISSGKFDRPWIGIQPQAIVRRGGRETAPGPADGLVIGDVYANTPAARGGLKAGDVILDAAGQRIRTIHDLQRVILSHRAGERLEFTIRRNEKSMKVPIASERMPDFDQAEW